MPHQTTMICAFCSSPPEYKKIHYDFPANREPAYNSSISLSSFAASFLLMVLETNKAFVSFEKKAKYSEPGSEETVLFIKYIEY